MGISFSEQLRRLRIEKGLSQQQLGDKLHVDRSTIAKWETGDRVPDAVMIALLSDQFGADLSGLLRASSKEDEPPQVIMVDDEKIILSGSVPVLSEALPGAVVQGFNVPSKALAYAQEHKIALALLDIEMGRVSGLDVCRELLAIDPRTNVIFITAYREYSFDAWETGACDFMLKPLTVEKVRDWLRRLRYPLNGCDAKNAGGGKKR